MEVYAYILTHFILNELLSYILEESIFNLGYVNEDIFIGKWLTNLQNSGDPDQMPHNVASKLV